LVGDSVHGCGHSGRSSVAVNRYPDIKVAERSLKLSPLAPMEPNKA